MYAFALILLCASALALPKRQSAVNTTTCNGQTYSYLDLAGYGFTPSTARDKFGDTAGGLGSSAVIDPKSWKSAANGTYSGTLWSLPDRGWNTNGTLNFQPRVQKFHITFNPASAGPAPNLQLQYLDTIRLTDPSGTPATGLDPDFHGPYLSFPGLPDLPAATYPGDGFGGDGAGGHRVSMDPEGLVLNKDGSFWISDEYGPFIYHFLSNGTMVGAIKPPSPFIPMRNGSESYSANSPPRYDPDREIVPSNGPTGRNNNQGFEGLTASSDGKSIYVLSQTALNQDGGLQGGGSRRHARLLQYVDSEVVAEYVVPLPRFTNTSVAAQSEIKFISPTQFLVLARDSGRGHGQDDSTSVYRHADVFDISHATNISGQFTVAPNGTLNANVTAATYCSWLDFNVNSQLAKFGLHNGGAQDSGLLNEKWESLSLVPAEAKDEYYLFSLSDNDFITQDGYMNGGQLPYSDESGYSLDNQVLVFKVKLPSGSKPRLG